MSSSDASTQSSATSPSQHTSTSYWGTYGWSGKYWKQPSIFTKFKETCDKTNEVFDDPATFFEAVTRGILAGIQNGAAHSNSTNGNKDTLFDKITQIATQGISLVSTTALEQLLENAESYDLDDADKKIREDSLATIKKAKADKADLKQTASQIWKTLNKYHILIGGMNVNVKTSGNEAMSKARADVDKDSGDGISPIHSLVRCQESYRTLRLRFDLKKTKLLETKNSKSTFRLKEPASEEELQKRELLELKTDELVDTFTHQTLHFSTIYTIHFLFGHTTDLKEYNKDIEKGGNIKKRYLKRFGKGSLGYFFYKCIYSIICWFIRPILAPTVEMGVDKMRAFLKNDVELLGFIEQKIGDMKNYYGRIEKARRDYLYSDRKDEAGSFEEYLEECIRLYGGKYNESDLIKIFNDYVVQNLVPRPNITLFGKHVPLLSDFLNWLVYSIRKLIIGQVLKKTGLIGKLLTQGSGSIHHAQLGLKRLLEQRLTRIVELIDLSRTGKATFSNTSLAKKKTQIISRQLHLQIQQHSQKLLRFIDIESCNGDDRKLRNLDNRVSHLFNEIIRACADLIKSEPFSLEKVLEDASTEVLETSLVSIFEDKEIQAETQLHTLFEILNKSYSYVPQEERAAMEHAYREECALVDENLNTLQEQLARSSVAAALETHLKNVSGERHNAMKAYVQEEQKILTEFQEELLKNDKEMRELILQPYHYDRKCTQSFRLKEALSHNVTLVEKYLGHISMQLRSPELEACYADVRGDLHNVFANLIYSLNQHHTTLEILATKLQEIDKSEEELIDSERCQKLLKKLSLEKSYKENKKILISALGSAPPSITDKMKDLLNPLSKLLKKYEKNIKLEETYNEFIELKQLKYVSKQIRKLEKLCNEYRDTAPSERSEAQIEEILRLQQQILSNDDPTVQKEILPLLETEDVDALCKAFTPFFFQSKPRLIQKTEKLKQDYNQKIELLLKDFPDLDEIPGRAFFEEKKTEMEMDFDEKLQEIYKELSKNNKKQKKLIKHSLEESERHSSKRFGESAYELEWIRTSGFDVKGCISVGQIKLYNNLAPELVARISPKISEATRTLVDAMGKPFHYKQLILRLLFVHIARLQNAATTS